MAHFARLNESNVVTMITVVSNEDLINDDGNEEEAFGIAVCESVVGPGPWIQTSYNGNFRGRYAAVGGTYDPIRDVFLPYRPYASWQLDENDEWKAPVAKPSEEGDFEWNESTQQWDEIQLES